MGIYHKSRLRASPFAESEWPRSEVPPLSEDEKKRIRANRAFLFPDGGPEDEEEAAAVLRVRWQGHFGPADPSDQIWVVTRRAE